MLISYQRVDFFKTAEIRFIGEIRIELTADLDFSQVMIIFIMTARITSQLKRRAKSYTTILQTKKTELFISISVLTILLTTSLN